MDNVGMPHLLRDLPALDTARKRLEALGYETLEEFQAAAQVAGPELERYLGQQLDSLLSRIDVAAESIPRDALQMILMAEYPLGVDLAAVPRLMQAPWIIVEDQEPVGCVNLIAQMPPVGDQGNRGTCVAFASLSAYEHALTRAGAMHDLSEQYLYWNCKKNDGLSHVSGTYLGVAFPLLQRDGCCLEETWPYQPDVSPGNETQGPPPPGAQFTALSFRLPSYRALAATSVPDFLAGLRAGGVVSFSIPVFNSWYRSVAVAYSGTITMPIPGEVRVGGHALCAVGCVELPGQPEIGGGRFIVRNSWGIRWGMNSSYGVGYGTLPYSYVARFGVEAYSVG